MALLWILPWLLAALPPVAISNGARGYSAPSWVPTPPAHLPPPSPPPPVGPPPVFDYFVAGFFWPPTNLPGEQHERAQHLINTGGAAAGFWTHGLWPSKFNGHQPSFCTPEVFRPEALGPFETSLMFYLRTMPTTLSIKLHPFWGHEWSRHGTCSGKDQLSYFVTVYHAASKVDVAAALSAAKLLPSSDQPYTKGQVMQALVAKFGTAISPTQGLACVKDSSGRTVVSEVHVCLDKSLALHDCAKYGVQLSRSMRSTLSGGGANSSATGGGGVRVVSMGVLGGGVGGGSGGGSGAGGSGAAMPDVPLEDQCPGAADLPVWLPDYRADEDEVSRVRWGLVLPLLLLAAAAVAAFLHRQQLLCWWRQARALLVPKPPTVVHYNLVHQPLVVECEELDMEWLWQRLPAYAEFVEDLPVGMGIRGGIARKLLKEKAGFPEPPTTMEVEVLIFVGHLSPEACQAARDAVTGMQLGGLSLEAQDVDVVAKSWLTEYFLTRDVTNNEVVIIKAAPGTALLFFSKDAWSDAAAGLIRPSVHYHRTDLHIAWAVEDDGTPYTGSEQVVRAMQCYLKGHATDYVLDAATWRHYRKQKLNKSELFKVLKPFHDDDEKLQAAVDHLIFVGFLSRAEVRRAGGINLLWGLLLQEMNATVSRHNSRMILTDLDPQSREKYLEAKKAAVAAKLAQQRSQARHTGFVPSEESCADLGLLTLHPRLAAFISSGAVFDLQAHMQKAVEALVHVASDRQCAVLGEDARQPPPQELVPAPASACADASTPAPSAAAPRGGSGSSVMQQAKSQWRALKAAAAAGGASVLALARSGSGPLSPTRQGSGGTVSVGAGSTLDTKLTLAPQLAAEIERVRTSLVSAAAAATSTPPSSQRTSMRELPTSVAAAAAVAGGASTSGGQQLQELEQSMRTAGRRQNKDLKQALGAGQSLLTAAPAPAAPPEPAPPAVNGGALPPATPPPGAKSADGRSGLGAVLRPVQWVLHSELKAKLPDQMPALPGSFYQAIGLPGGDDDEYVPLISDRDVPRRRRVELLRLLQFCAGVMGMDRQLLVAAYALMLAGLAFRLCLPRVEAAIFDAFNDVDTALFRRALVYATGIMFAEVSLMLAGRVCMELFTRKAMRTLFHRFFEHVIYQDLPFFARLSPGELMARTSGDSLTLRTMVSSTAYNVVEGMTLFLGSLAFLMFSAWGLITSQPSILMSFFAVVTLNVLEGWLLGGWLRQINLLVRQSLGRMFGFTLDAFTKVETVAALGLEKQMVKDYRNYATDYFWTALMMNVVLHGHRAFTSVLSASLRLSLLWFGGSALFSDLTTVGTLFALLRYVGWLQKGLKGTSDAYARLMAGIGSVERIVELHDRGVFGNVPADSVGAEGDDKHGHTLQDSTLPTLSAFVPRPHALFSKGGAAGPPTGQDGAVRCLAAQDKASLRAPLLLAAARDRGEEVRLSMPVREPRPDFSAMTGGIKLDDVHLTMRSRTDRLLLHDCTLELLPGEACLLAGEDSESKTGLMSLVMLRLVPYKGHVFFQLPASAVPSASCLVPEESGPPGATPTPLPPLPRDGATWVPYSFRKDDMRVVRRHVAHISTRVAGLFCTTVEDNVAVATGLEVTQAEVREVCRHAGLDKDVANLPDGYATMVGDGSGVQLPAPTVLRLVLARALIRKPKIVLLDDADVFAEAITAPALNTIIKGLCTQGVAVIIASNRPQNFPGISKVFTMHLGRPWPVPPPTPSRR